MSVKHTHLEEPKMIICLIVCRYERVDFHGNDWISLDLWHILEDLESERTYLSDPKQDYNLTKLTKKMYNLGQDRRASLS